MDFFNQTGKLAIGSRLRMLTDKITVDAAAIYKMFGVDLKPKWFPVFFVLSRGEAKTITSIAKEIGHSHPSPAPAKTYPTADSPILQSPSKDRSGFAALFAR